MLLEQTGSERHDVLVQYRRAVPDGGNRTALQFMGRVFRRSDACWRGLGVIPGSGLELGEEFAAFDARPKVPVRIDPSRELPAGCGCGRVMQGLITPAECPLFRRICTPSNPVGPCMVSSEGSCAAYFKYE